MSAGEVALASSQEVTLLPSAARTATPTTSDITNIVGNAALTVIIDLTAFTTAASLTVAIDGKDPASGKYFNILTSAALAAVATTRLRVGPQVAAVANQVAQDYLPRTFRITVTHGNANSTTYSVGYILTRA